MNETIAETGNEITIKINDVAWSVKRVDPNHAGLYVNGVACVGTTWPAKAEIYIADNQAPSKMLLTIRHELAHAFLNCTQIRAPESFSEEEICEFVALHGGQVMRLAEVIVEAIGNR
ncbi:MAG: hypothetical protein IJ017_04515 [Oscillospiraceae bacterium]|nr:hypothetical protein [Oscillospiraceae bacterium]